MPNTSNGSVIFFYLLACIYRYICLICCSVFFFSFLGLNSQDKLISPQLSYGKVGFSAGALQAHRPVPPDLSDEEFISVCSIESKPIPPSHLSVVIASYDKTIGKTFLFD